MENHRNAPHVEYIYNAASDRERLVRQYDLQKGMFDDGFEIATSMVAQSNDLHTAQFSVLDMGCGEGLYSDHIARDYPNARIVGYDRDNLAVETANATFGDGDRIQFFQHNATDPLPSTYVPEGGFDIAFAWMVLLHIKDIEATLRNTHTALRSGGILMYFDPPPHLIDFPHPSLVALSDAVTQTARSVGMSVFGTRPQELLYAAGFQQVEQRTIQVPLGGMTPLGKKNLRHLLASFIAARDAVTRTLGTVSIDEFDHHVNRVMTEVTTDMGGTGYLLLGFAMT